MNKTGLAALAESYGLERGELHQLKLLDERFFDQLRDELARFTARPIRMVELKQRTESFASFCNTRGHQHVAVLGFDHEAAVAVRMDNAFALALIGAVFGGDNPQIQDVSGGAELRPLTAAEGYILANTFGVALVRAVSRVFSPLFGGRSGLALMSMEHRPGLIPNTFTAGEQMVTAGLTCLLAGAGGAIEIGLPLSMIMQVRTRLVPAQIRNHDPSQGLGRSRRLLGATFELEAVLGCVAASLAEVRALKPGSVVMLQKLDAKVPRVELRACDQILCTGTVVEDRGWYRFLIQKKGKIDVESAANR